MHRGDVDMRQHVDRAAQAGPSICAFRAFDMVEFMIIFYSGNYHCIHRNPPDCAVIINSVCLLCEAIGEAGRCSIATG